VIYIGKVSVSAISEFSAFLFKPVVYASISENDVLFFPFKGKNISLVRKKNSHVWEFYFPSLGTENPKLMFYFSSCTEK
jgi:hypothetical protein